jgi:class 3 adenylate cyclase/tetratricopeptide (TPR) repeat protein
VPGCSTCGFESDRPFRFCPECGTAQAVVTPSGEQRKTVTVLFCDLMGSTALGETLDPERLRTVLARYFERMKGIVERHGGTVEKFIGDAVMAVFGVPVLHEDDALRAVRAAAEMRDALPEMRLQGRIGVMTGEVVTGTEERLATGDALNVAARLEQSAEPGHVLIGHPTFALVRRSVEIEVVEPLALKGKAEPVPAYRLVRVRDVPDRLTDAPFVGRRRELAALADAWARVDRQHRCELVTVIGDAGVGKSRLAEEFLASIDATILRGRCLPYGEGITYWPVVEVLKQLAVEPPDEAAAVAIRSLLGESDATVSTEAIAWAFRKTLENASAAGPLVAVFDDIQWGEQTFLDLVEHVALLSVNASILLLCVARPELNERHPTWPVTFRLEPLDDDDVEELIADRVAGPLRVRIARAAGGNPLFIEEMLAMAVEADREVAVPPTLQALLAARLDQLDPVERRVLEAGAIEGEIFHLGAVRALASEETQVTPRVSALVRKDLIRPHAPQIKNEDGFRFRHILIRDAAYDSMPKAVRSDLHVRYASWLEQHGIDLLELDELAGYHLERACTYRADLGRPADGELLAAGRRRLTAAGIRAHVRQDYAAAVSLLERASAMVPEGEVDLAVEAELGDALLWMGRGDDALHRANDLAERAVSRGNRVAELCARIQAGIVEVFSGIEGATDRLEALVDESLPVLEAADDDLALYIAYTALASAAEVRARMDAGLEALDRAIAHARRAGHEPPSSLGSRAAFRFFGTTPVSELLEWLDEQEPPAGHDYFLDAYRAGSLAMLGRFEEAREILTRSRAELAEQGGGVLLANITAFESAWVELWAGDPAAAAVYASDGFRLHDELGEQGFLSGAAGNVAQALYGLDRLDEAEAWAVRAADVGAGQDVVNGMLWRQVRAKVLARRGEHSEAERLVREAVAMGDATESPDVQGDAYADLAEVLALAGLQEAAAAALDVAIERYERKGNRVSVDRVRTRLTDLERQAPR